MSDSFTVAVDPTNPGQFFACCGLLELADRLHPGAEGHFVDGGRGFVVADGGSLKNLLQKIGQVKLTSSLGDDGLKRLGTLLSVDKKKLSAQDILEKERLRAMWQAERVHVSEPFDLWLDWWWEDVPSRQRVKTWAAKQLVMDIAKPMIQAVQRTDWTGDSIRGCLQKTANLKGLPFYFDSANNAQNTPRDNGFATDAVKAAPGGVDRPLLEFLAFVGLQRFRPERPAKSDLIRYSTWTMPMAASVASATAAGLLSLVGSRKYEFRILKRSKYMRAFFTASPYQGV